MIGNSLEFLSFCLLLFFLSLSTNLYINSILFLPILK